LSGAFDGHACNLASIRGGAAKNVSSDFGEARNGIAQEQLGNEVVSYLVAEDSSYSRSQAVTSAELSSALNSASTGAGIAANHELGENAVRRDLSRLIAQATKTQRAPPANLSEAKRLSTACQKKVTTKAKSATRSIIDRCRLLNVKVKTVTPLVTNKWIAAIGGAIVTEGLLTACPRNSSSSELITAANIMPGKTLFQ